MKPSEMESHYLRQTPNRKS